MVSRSMGVMPSMRESWLSERRMRSKTLVMLRALSFSAMSEGRPMSSRRLFSVRVVVASAFSRPDDFTESNVGWMAFRWKICSLS